MRKILAMAALAATTVLAAPVLAQQGVSENEVLIGVNGDLSGIFAPFTVQALQGAQLRIDEANETGGVHGRQIRLLVEDHGYQIPRAMANFNKLINSDGVFAMMMNLGTPMNIAGFPLMDARGVPNLAPLTGARSMLDGSPLRFAFISFYDDQTAFGVEHLTDELGLSRVCAMYIPSDFGEAVIAGTRRAVEADEGLTLAAETTHKPDEGDFTGALTRLRDEGCELVTLALGVRQTIIAVSTAKRLGWDDAVFLGSAAGFHEAIAGQPGGATEGYYAAAGWVDWKPRADDPDVSEWVEAYRTRFDADPGLASILGLSAAEQLVRALEAAGPDLTTESFLNGMASLDYDDPYAGIRITYGEGDNHGAEVTVLSVVRDGQFEEVARREAPAE